MWSSEQHNEIVKALAVVSEVMGTEVSPAAAQLMVGELSAYPANAVLKALRRCARECKHRLVLADVIERIDDTRPGADAAWGAFPKTDEEAGVVTDEMLAAWGAARKLYADGDKIGARMAFRERYDAEVMAARTEGRPVVWRITAGWDKTATEGAAIEAMQRGLIEPAHALAWIAPDRHHAALQAAGLPALAAPNPEGQLEVQRMLAAAITGKTMGD